MQNRGLSGADCTGKRKAAEAMRQPGWMGRALVSSIDFTPPRTIQGEATREPPNWTGQRPLQEPDRKKASEASYIDAENIRVNMERGRGWEAGRLGLTYADCCCSRLVTRSCPTLLQPRGLKPPRPLHPWDSPGKNPGVGCHFLLQGIFPTQGSNPNLLHRQAKSLPLSTWEAPLPTTMYTIDCE